MSCNIKTIKTCEIFSDSIFARNFSFDEALQKVTAKIQKSDSANVQNIELTKISNIFSLEIEPLNLAVGNYKITYIFEILISGKLIRKTGLIENLSILKIGCNCEKSENENLDFSIELNQTVIDVELNFSVLNIGSISESGKSAFDIAVENGFVGTETEWLISLKGTDGSDGKDGTNGQNGNDFKFSDFTPSQLNDLKVKGDPFTFQDLTPAQVVLMKGTDGVNGANGANGTNGKDGKDGVNGTNGTNGINGKNAFELWQIENPSGTYNDFKNDIIRKKSISLLENYASSSNILTGVNNLNFNLQSGKNYRIKLLGTVQSVAITTGINIAFTFDGNIIANGFVESSLTHLASATTLRSTIFNIDASTATIGSNLITTGTGMVNIPVMLNAEMVVRCIDSGTFKTWFASEINASQAQLNIGTTFIIEEI